MAVVQQVVVILVFSWAKASKSFYSALDFFFFFKLEGLVAVSVNFIKHPLSPPGYKDVKVGKNCQFYTHVVM